MGNAIQSGEPWMGMATTPTKVLLLSSDMNLYQFNLRWGEKFKPKFYFAHHDKLNVTADTFRTTTLYNHVQEAVNQEGIGLVMFDALGGLHVGRSNKDDETASEVDQALTEWLPGVAMVILHHDRKARPGPDGTPVPPDGEDFLGSQMWRSNCQSQLHMWRVGAHMSVVQHMKSQVSKLYEDAVKIYIDLDGIAEGWDQRRADEVSDMWRNAMKETKSWGLPASQQVERVMQFYATSKNPPSQRTVWRWKSLAAK